MEQGAIELPSAGDAEQGESVVELAREQLDDVLDAVGATGGQSPQRRATDESRVRPEGKRLDDVCAAANAAIHEHLDSPVHGVHYSGSPVAVATAVSSCRPP